MLSSNHRLSNKWHLTANVNSPPPKPPPRSPPSPPPQPPPQPSPPNQNPSLNQWIGHPSSDGDANSWYLVTYGNGTFVAASLSGANNRTMTSTDNGITWKGYPSSNDANTWVPVTYGNGIFIAVAQAGTNRTMTYSTPAPPSPPLPPNAPRRRWPPYWHSRWNFGCKSMHQYTELCVLCVRDPSGHQCWLSSTLPNSQVTATSRITGGGTCPIPNSILYKFCYGYDASGGFTNIGESCAPCCPCQWVPPFW